MARILIPLLLVVLLVPIGALITVDRTRSEVGLDQTIEGADPAFGRSRFVKYGCGGCHEINGVSKATGKVGPNLDNFGNRTVIAGVLPNTPENLTHWIRFPQEVKPGNAMPNLGVTEDDARAMAAYLYQLARN